MTALGVQVVGTVLNKTVSTGDNLWGLPWADLPPSLQVYGIGDIQFGIHLLFCASWNHTQRSVPQAGYHVQDSEDEVLLSCILDPGVDPEEPGRS